VINTNNREHVKPFKLVKYFSLTSLFVILLGTLILSSLITRRAQSVLLKKSKDYAALMAENLNHQIFVQFILPTALQFGRIQLRNKVQFERLDKVVRNTLHSFKVEMVNIYDLRNIISYSFNEKLVGRKGLGGINYQQAVNGKSSFRMIRTGQFWEMMIGIPKETKLCTYTPLRAERPLSVIKGPILGVMEIVQDLSEDSKTIARFQLLISLISALVMGMLFVVLRYVVKHGEEIIERRAQERLELKERLSHAERLATVGKMVAGISHEIRNPLGIISSTAELLKQRLNTFDPKNRLPDVIIQETDRLNRIITDFLSFARPKIPDLMPCRVDEVLEKNLTFLEPELERQRVKIKKDYRDIPEIQADPHLLYQAFLNILINAMQSMPGGGTIHIDIFTYDKRLNIAFNDEGPGIDEEVLQKIGEPFFTTKEKGTGLGFAIVKNIVQAHRGSVKIENRERRGARVLVSLPLN